MRTLKTCWKNIWSFFNSWVLGIGSCRLVAAAMFAVVLTSHLYKLDSIPTGFYIDESAIGYNAALIAKSGVDEYGIHLPIYFKSFYDYKAPVFIYAAALVFKLFGISEFNLRLTSFAFFVLALFFALELVRKIFDGSKVIYVYALLSFGFLPHFFTVSRIGFEVISQLTAISATVLLVWIIFQEHRERNFNVFKMILCGLALGISVYTYPTARILSFLMLGSLWIIYHEQNHIKKLIAITSTFLLCLVPYIIFAIHNAGALTARFRSVTYIFESIPISEKVLIFIHNYFTYWSRGFLIRIGDSNLRHSTGYGGVIFCITLLLFLVGLASAFTNRKTIVSRFYVFILVNLFLSPVSAALTSDGTPHALRSILMSYYILLISCYGLRSVLSIRNGHQRHALAFCALVLLMFEVFGYQFHYFIFYPSQSAKAMQSINFKESLQAAVDQNPKEVVFMDKTSSPTYAHLKFYSFLIKNTKQIPIRQTKQQVSSPGSCLLYDRKYEAEIARTKYPFVDFEIRRDLSPIQGILKAVKYPEIFKVRCFKNSG